MIKCSHNGCENPAAFHFRTAQHSSLTSCVMHSDAARARSYDEHEIEAICGEPEAHWEEGNPSLCVIEMDEADMEWLPDASLLEG